MESEYRCPTRIEMNTVGFEYEVLGLQLEWNDPKNKTVIKLPRYWIKTKVERCYEEWKVVTEKIGDINVSYISTRYDFDDWMNRITTLYDKGLLRCNK